MNFNNLNKMQNKYTILMEKVSNQVSNVIFTYIFMIAYKALLDVIYCKYIGGLYAFHYVEISIPNCLNGWAAVIVMAWFFHKCYSQNVSSAIIYIIVVLFYFIPITTYCSFGGGSSSFLFFAILYWGVLTFLQFKMPVVVLSFKNDNQRRKKYENVFFYVAIVAISVMIIYVWGKYTDFRMLLSLFNVYDVRREASEYALSMLMKYLLQATRIIVPMLILLALKKKKYLSFLWLLFITFINFSYDGSKTVILFPILLIGGYIFYREKMINCILPGVILVQILSIIEQIIGRGIIITLVFRRQAILLAKLSEDYYRFFIGHPIDIFRNSILGKFGFESLYNQDISKVIGNNYETQVINCNNGLLADVWANLGIIGIFVMPVVLVVCFRIFDMVSYQVNQRLIVSLAVYYAVMFMNTTWSIVLLTHGFLIMCIILLVFPRSKCEKMISQMQ